jgi:hypothetical protein
MLGAVLMKRGKDGKERLLNEEDMKPAEGYSRFRAGEFLTDKSDMTAHHEGSCAGLGSVGFALLTGSLLNRPKTYERLIHDLYVTGWTIDEVKTLLNGGKTEEKHD